MRLDVCTFREAGSVAHASVGHHAELEWDAHLALQGGRRVGKAAAQRQPFEVLVHVEERGRRTKLHREPYRSERHATGHADGVDPQDRPAVTGRGPDGRLSGLADALVAKADRARGVLRVDEQHFTRFESRPQALLQRSQVLIGGRRKGREPGETSALLAGARSYR